MAGFITTEGKVVLLNLLLNNVDENRGSNLQVGLITNITGLVDGSTLAQVTEPDLINGYQRQVAIDGNWTVDVNANADYTPLTFTAVGGSFSAPIYGYFVATTGTNPKLLIVEVDPNAPRTILAGQSYKVDLTGL